MLLIEAYWKKCTIWKEHKWKCMNSLDSPVSWSTFVTSLNRAVTSNAAVHRTGGFLWKAKTREQNKIKTIYRSWLTIDILQRNRLSHATEQEPETFHAPTSKAGNDLFVASNESQYFHLSMPTRSCVLSFIPLRNDGSVIVSKKGNAVKRPKLWWTGN